MPNTRNISSLIFGAPLDPFSTETRRHIALIALLAWIGLGADGLSSSCYGPEEAFLALGDHRQLGLYMAIATAATVFIIAVAYNQVIELFPSGGGGYKVATNLIGPYTRLGFRRGVYRPLYSHHRDLHFERPGCGFQPSSRQRASPSARR